MNKTEYMNLLQHEISDLPKDVQDRLILETELKFTEPQRAGRTEHEICDGLSHPRVIAAQARASLRFQHLKKDFSLANVFGLMIALIGLMIFNLLMVIPAAIYSVFLFASYIGSLAVWIAGVAVLAASMSGVPELTIKTGAHHWHTRSHHGYDYKHYGNRDVRVEVDASGIKVEDATLKSGESKALEVVRSGDRSAMHFDGEPSTVTIKNQMKPQHFFLGLMVLLIGTGLLLLCVMMTRLTLLGVKKYLLWNVSILRAPISA